ncbi:MAG: type II toxin-antitoxin system RelE/ParE family toxin [Candidatus Woesearchaeota archaeon]|jgi:mRNA-degrading endonuclease RelE of RelBE toxin-antitoxin system|nr:type II toxin-antitoxin system RelE/ParE family toxin [Candidatus Woesearchaeota archaeon]MDP7323289.1 type II toxin-antitoxin system RelE/ParE family toxin [Candidatus Woesearchaeota archaeon]MDP7458409.1 type II toxin-antitoxin system RelE/ParE family toxin [Candidatus Woesearchaeota archaeon]
MVIVEFHPLFEKRVRKLKNKQLRDKIKKQIKKIVDNPKIGKPMMHSRKGTREVYIPPFRLSYAWMDNKIILLEFYHKDKQ